MTPEETAAHQRLVNAFRDAIGIDGPYDGVILAQKVPLICKAIVEINLKQEEQAKDVADIKDNLKWGVRLVLGAVILAVIALIIKP